MNSEQTPVSPDRTVLVVGATRGIGKATVQAFSQRGYTVVGTYRNEEHLLESYEKTENPHEFKLKASDNQHADMTTVRFFPCDTKSEKSIENLFLSIQNIGLSVDIVVIAAGITNDGLLIKMDESAFMDVFQTNTLGSFLVAKHALRSMVKKRWGRIIFVSSIVGHTGQVGQANYAASKAALTGLARSIAREYAKRSITCNVVAPGPVDTEMFQSLSAQQQQTIIDAVPVGRIAQPIEVAESIVFLTKENSGFINGAVLAIDGGLGMGL